MHTRMHSSGASTQVRRGFSAFGATSAAEVPLAPAARVPALSISMADLCGAALVSLGPELTPSSAELRVVLAVCARARVAYVYSQTRAHTDTRKHANTLTPYVNTYVRTYVHTYIHAYIHTYIHTYIH